MKSWIYTIASFSLIILFLTGCGISKQQEESSKGEVAKQKITVEGDVDKFFPQLTNEVQENEILVEMKTSKGTIKLKLFPELAPKTVENFVTHSKNGYYDGLTFHRVIQDFMIQGGDPKGDGTGGESIYGESFEDELNSQLFHVRGALSMANEGRSNTNGSQFFIVQNAEINSQTKEAIEKAGYPTEIVTKYIENGGTPHLDYKHSVFGYVIEGMDVVDKIAAVEVDSQSKPANNVVIEKMMVIE
ncbi:peptidylprolyl isomerase [Bacillus spongiae]|uniref:Peptidyl-prolyl cis-trans isomerase n=1 Tax=Bacillus spongiae TaxID=2683610 RepID=A0ABU8HES7_9BACI